MQREETKCQFHETKSWKKPLEKDPEYIRWYPPTLERISSDEMWQAQKEDTIEKEIAFYVHVPFCLSICKYCPFTKYILRADHVHTYLRALVEEIARTTTNLYFHNSRVVAGYLGGGTPSSLGTDQLAKIISCYRQHLSILNGAEMSIEANPDTVDEKKLREIHSMGFNRISFGVQSFDDSLLRLVGRTHSSGQSRRVIELAHKVGIENICIDLLYKLPGQSLKAWEQDLLQAVDLGVHHVSTYCLYIPLGTKLRQELVAGKLVQRPNEQQEFRMYGMAEDILRCAGYIQYTAYDFALPGKQSRHHATNWQAPQGEYCGFGPGAFSHNRGYIYCNVADLESYEKLISRGKLPVALGKKISREEQMSRFMVLGMKYLTVDKMSFRNIFGEELDTVFAKTLCKLEEWGLISNSMEKVVATRRGKLYMTNLCKAFFTDESKMQPQPRAPVWC